jgi:hypothetical protein
MPAFRIYFIGLNRRIIDAVTLDCIDDGHAVEEAKKLLGERAMAQGIEVWEGARRVASLAR